LALKEVVSILDLNSKPLKHMSWQVWQQSIEKFLDPGENQTHFRRAPCRADFYVGTIRLQGFFLCECIWGDFLYDFFGKVG